MRAEKNFGLQRRPNLSPSNVHAQAHPSPVESQFTAYLPHSYSSVHIELLYSIYPMQQKRRAGNPSMFTPR